MTIMALLGAGIRIKPKQVLAGLAMNGAFALASAGVVFLCVKLAYPALLKGGNAIVAQAGLVGLCGVLSAALLFFNVELTMAVNTAIAAKRRLRLGQAVMAAFYKGGCAFAALIVGGWACAAFPKGLPYTLAVPIALLAAVSVLFAAYQAAVARGARWHACDSLRARPKSLWRLAAAKALWFAAPAALCAVIGAAVKQIIQLPAVGQLLMGRYWGYAQIALWALCAAVLLRPFYAPAAANMALAAYDGGDATSPPKTA